MKNINEKKIESTFDEPKTAHGMEFQDKFDKTMIKKGVNLKEVDNALNEKEQSLKKKIFNLSKMEALVHSDPKLSAVYNEMAEDGEEKYGYHYNETIMNIIFNDYILNSAKYLQKYKNAIPKKKKRRDKSGIEQLKKQAKDIEKRREELKGGKKKDVNESTVASNAGSFSTKAGDKENHKAAEITSKEWEELINARVSEIAKEEKMKRQKKKTKVNPTDDYVGGNSAQPTWKGGKIVKNPNNILNESDMNNLESLKKQAKEISKKEGVVQHINKISNDKYKISDFFDSDSTVVSYENGSEINEQDIDETTSASSAAGPGTSYVGYATPAAWGSGELMDTGKKTKKDKKSFWDGGKIVKESNYLTDPSGFKKLYDMLNENNDFELRDKITTPEQYKEFVQQLKSQGKKISNEDVRKIAGQALYDLAIRLANRMLPMRWDDLPDVNSMWDYINELGGMSLKELHAAVKDAVNDRIEEEGMSLDDLMEKKNVVNEKAKSTSQQQAAGMALAAKRGEMNIDDLKGAAKEMYDSMSADELEDFAETKHKNLPKHVDEHHLTKSEDKIDYIMMAANHLLHKKPTFNKDSLFKLTDDEIDQLYKKTEMALKSKGIDPISLNEKKHMKEENTMIDGDETSMKMKPPIGDQGGDMPSGMQTAGGMQESKKIKTLESTLNKLDKELKLFEMHHKKLQEDRKPGAIVLKDRLGKENQKNFKKDLPHSGTKEMIDITKELEYKDQQTEIDDPKELTQKIEKEVLKNTDGESFKNVGNSTNNAGDEIPKRNLTDKESTTVDLIRQGLGDYVYDNKPDERFEERMKRDMGEENYKMRQERLKFKADAPMYNKDTQPVDDGIEKVQFDKQKSGWNERYGIKESSVTGKYRNELGKMKLIDFQLNEVKEVKTVDTDEWEQIFFEGLGNTYDSRTNINEDVNGAISEYKFYTDGTTVFAKHISKVLTESNKKEKKQINEQFEKMKHLFGYNPKDFIDTKKTKL